jgi:hypothetical protein
MRRYSWLRIEKVTAWFSDTDISSRGQPRDAFPAVAVTTQAAHAVELTRTGYELVGLMWPPVQPSAALLVAERDHRA